jgi:hypothetical protein
MPNKNKITLIEKDKTENKTNSYITNPFSIKIINQVFALPSLVNRLYIGKYLPTFKR